MPADGAAPPAAGPGIFHDPRFVPPLLITCILLAAHLSFGILESFERTLLAIAASSLTESLLGRLFRRTWPHLASAYITGISVGILVRSPALWPFALGSVISITSKYVLRVRGRHLWNPSNFGICALLFLAPFVVAPLSVQWGNNLWPMLAVWVLGVATLRRLRRLHITATYVVSFLGFAVLRSAMTGAPLLAEIAPITGPMYQLFIFFMITDPRTTLGTTRGRCAVGFAIAAVEALLRLAEVIYAPFYALFVVGPAALLLEMRRAEKRRPVAAPASA
ncbi:MAG: RnfABCDGE type electron transport complex subunit D [Gemmatimonadetes bacterium]|nr:RnfABCDGE type electron transport complex subunit D [Gemmatimonadota bacterium]